jgi:hypothetical protein
MATGSADLTCNCGAPPEARLADHATSCPVFVALQAYLVAGALRVHERNEERATGKIRFRSAAAAVRWYYRTRESWGSARGLAIDPDHEGTGAPNRGADDPKRVRFAAVAYALRLAEEDDRSNHREKCAPLARWLAQNVAGGRAYAWIAEETNGRWSELEVTRRVERALREIGKRLRERGLLESQRQEA